MRIASSSTIGKLFPRKMLSASAKLYRNTLGGNIYSLQRRILRSPQRSAQFIPLFSQAGKSPAGNIIDIAMKISEGDYAFLGLEIDRETRINWHKDYKSGFVWPLFAHNKVRSVTPENVDLKHPWELSSFFHLFPVAVAYAQTGRKEFQIFVIDQIKDWLANNPCPLGVNWANPMVVALRLILLIEVVNLACPGNDKPIFRKEVDAAIWQHFLFLVNNLENLGPCPGNHYLANIVGVIWTCLYFSPRRMMIAFYRKWAVGKLSKEIQRQTHADGMNFEGSTCYHRLVTELLLYAFIIMGKNGIDIPASVQNQLQKMLEVLYLFADSRGNIPIIGDNDNCRLFYGSDYFDWNPQNIQYLMAVGARLYDDSFPTYGSDKEICQWIWNKDGPENRWHTSVSGRFSKNRAVALESSNFYISRNKNDYLLINCNHPGQITCGHTHNDTLSFILCFDGTEIFVDPGCYVYTGDLAMRNYFRSTGCHNVLQVNDEEQWPIPEKKPFLLPKGVPPRVLTWESDDQEDVLEGEHYGYLRLPGKLIHRRYYRYRKELGELTVRDHVFSTSSDIEGTASRYNISTFFHLSKDVVIGKQKDNSIDFKGINGTPLCRMSWPGKDADRVEVKEGWIAKGYGTRDRAGMLVFETETSLPYSLNYTICKTGLGAKP